jgi:hypothetical protein
MTTPRQWAETILKQLGAPVSGNNVASMVAWAAFEGGHWGNSARYNPLNTSQDWPGATSAFGTHIKAYDSWQAGLDATIKTLKNGFYNEILADLRDSKAPETTLDAVRRSKWGTTALNPNNWKALYQGYADKQDNTSMPVSASKSTNWGLIGATALALGLVAGAVSYKETGTIFGLRPSRV